MARTLLDEWLEESEENRRLHNQESLIAKVTADICEEMERQSVTRAQLAERMGTSRSNITQVLTGSRNMTLRTLADIGHFLGVDVDVRLRRSVAEEGLRGAAKNAKCISMYVDEERLSNLLVDDVSNKKKKKSLNLRQPPASWKASLDSIGAYKNVGPSSP
ncbi:helix-turn-helix domain-containing protein [Halorhodospira sp. 9622]|uniref:helix-turn-helix domain-containing protein n=1 Tax=Halorhodospira sp. 9622 TaxID=2899136 RepID=UPI001EE876B6|nr:helix-turn-helix transcriptional regulator [Halorhodospira sp. 9622]MCG5538965.1 helix-turn-helix transcriptional regulator [Halorhodospira sp. 9622]